MIVSETNRQTDRQSLFLGWEIASLVKAQEEGLEFSPQNDVGQRLLSVLRTLVNETTHKAVSCLAATEGRPPTAYSLSKVCACVRACVSRPSVPAWESGSWVQWWARVIPMPGVLAGQPSLFSELQTT